MKNILEYNVEDFFGDVFKNSYVCAMRESGGQFEGCIPSRECDNLKEFNVLFERNLS